MERELKICSNRKALKYTKQEYFFRVLWIFGHFLFRFSPRPFFRWRCFILRIFGAEIGKNVNIYNSATIYMPWNLVIKQWSSIGEHAFIYNLGKIIIDEKATISHRAHLCAGTHDYSDPSLPLLKPEIRIGRQTWVCADAFIGPGVTVGEGAVVGACAVVTKDIKPWCVVAGNPAVFVKKRELRQI